MRMKIETQPLTESPVVIKEDIDGDDIGSEDYQSILSIIMTLRLMTIKII